MRGVLLLVAAGLGLCAPPARALEPGGDLILLLRNQDFEGDRSSFELSWLSPSLQGFKVEVGGAYQSFDASDWGYGILGAVYSFGGNRSHLSTRLRQGSGDAPGGDFDYTDWRAGLTHLLFANRLALQGELQLIRVGDDPEYNLAHLGLDLFPHESTALGVRYFHHVAGDATHGASARADYHMPFGSFFGGYAWSSADIDVLRSGGALATKAQETHEYYVGITRPWERHTLSLVGSRRHVGDAEFHAIDLVWRFSLASPPPLEVLR